MKWFEERLDRIVKYAVEKNVMEAGAVPMVMDSEGPASAHTEKNNYDLEGIITSDTVDLSGEVIVPEGGDWSYLDTVKAVFVDHDPSNEKTVGAVRYRQPIMSAGRLRGWKARIRLARGKALADECMILAKLGVLHSSIGVLALDCSKPTAEEKARYEVPGRKLLSVVRKWRAIEVTLTPAPMNSDCRMDPMGFVEKSYATVRRALADGVITEQTAAALGAVPAKASIVAGFHGGYTWIRHKPNQTE